MAIALCSFLTHAFMVLCHMCFWFDTQCSFYSSSILILFWRVYHYSTMYLLSFSPLCCFLVVFWTICHSHFFHKFLFYFSVLVPIICATVSVAVKLKQVWHKPSIFTYSCHTIYLTEINSILLSSITKHYISYWSSTNSRQFNSTINHLTI